MVLRSEIQKSNVKNVWAECINHVPIRPEQTNLHIFKTQFQNLNL